MWLLSNIDFSENSGTPKSSILIGFSIIFTIHFGVPLFLETPIWLCWVSMLVFGAVTIDLEFQARLFSGAASTHWTSTLRNHQDRRPTEQASFHRMGFGPSVLVGHKNLQQIWFRRGVQENFEEWGGQTHGILATLWGAKWSVRCVFDT